MDNPIVMGINLLSLISMVHKNGIRKGTLIEIMISQLLFALNVKNGGSMVDGIVMVIYLPLLMLTGHNDGISMENSIVIVINPPLSRVNTVQHKNGSSTAKDIVMVINLPSLIFIGHPVTPR
jgi:hypothetical protein